MGRLLIFVTGSNRPILLKKSASVSPVEKYAPVYGTMDVIEALKRFDQAGSTTSTPEGRKRMHASITKPSLTVDIAVIPRAFELALA